MIKIFNTLEELMRSCSNSELKSRVSSVLMNDKYIKWEFSLTSEDGDMHRSEFVSPIEGTDLVRRLSCEADAHGERLHTFISGFASVPA